MTSKLLTFDYFSRTLQDPSDEVFIVLDDKDHLEHANLLADLRSIDKEELEEYVSSSYVDHLIRESKDKDQGRREFFLIHLLQKGIANERISRLISSKTDPPSPYNSNNLKNISIDKNHLVNIEQFNLDCFGLEKDGLVYTLCPMLEQSNSSYWIFSELLELKIKRGLNIRLRLDPLIEVPLDRYNPMMFKMQVWGKPLDWDLLKTLRNDDFGQWFDEKEYNRNGFTDYVWSPKGSEIHFTCEELPKPDFKGIKSSRYFHAIFNMVTGGIIHCDGAIRVYSDEELAYRSQFHVKDSEVRKA